MGIKVSLNVFSIIHNWVAGAPCILNILSKIMELVDNYN